ncbi:hypothetical protein [Halobacterium hubeiense]|uniref:hypothetical protein n=1 Tax=Halobacterium hubeiense TaxID=1407499 RepID=UPI003C716437
MESSGRSRRTSLLAVLAAAELLLRLLDGTAGVLAEVVDTTVGSAALSATLSVVSVDGGALGVALRTTQFAFLAATVYRFSPLLFTGRIENWRTARVPMLVVYATASAVVAWLFYGVPESGYVPILLVAAGTAVSAAAFAAADADPFARPDGRFYELLYLAADRLPDVGPSESGLYEGDRYTVASDASGLFPVFTRWFLNVVLTGFVTTCAVYFGILVYVVGLFSPIPEAAVVAFAAARLATSRVEAVDERAFDVEPAIYRVVTTVLTDPIRGFGGLVFVLSGLLTAGLAALTGVGIVTLLTVADLRTLLGQPVRAAGFASVLLGTFVFGGYGLWYWRTVASRFTAVFAPDAVDAPDDAPPHPVWLSVPQSLLLVTAAAVTLYAALHLHQNPDRDMWPLWLTVLSALGLACCTAVVAAAYRRTKAVDSTALETERWKLPLSASVQVLATAAVATVVLSYDAVKAQGIEGLATSAPLSFVVPVGVVVTVSLYYFLPAATTAAEQFGPRRSAAAKFAYFLCLGGSAGVAVAVSGRPAEGALGAVLVALVGSVVAYREHRWRTK